MNLSSYYIRLFADGDMFQLLGLLFIVTSVSANCVWHKVCYSTDPYHNFNCPSNEPGFPLEDNDVKAKEILLRRCPDIYTNCKMTRNFYLRDSNYLLSANHCLTVQPQFYLYCWKISDCTNS